eukprot:CAMPEP_0117610666 /NCGR_PEP_ID=MMETSP0784-20121206/81987_1 /TAXON_ID=39447 /ORGANISM="" /LENGTH=687 /DNA_ID=CAMNT_0005414069 /DNA_START=91 /DNA_END=2154 /DNA_ORIENTATION=-
MSFKRQAVLFMAASMAALLPRTSSVTLEARSRAGVNPIRKVVNMLKAMEAKVQKEGDERETVFEKFVCYCKDGTASLEASIKAASEKIPQLESSIKEAQANHDQLKEALKQHKAERDEAKNTVSSATELREKSAAAFEKESTETKANIQALGVAITAISKGMTGFLQTSAASVLRGLALSADMSSGDRDILAAFLSGGGRDGDSQGYAPQSGEIVGVLKQMKEQMEKDLAEMISTEEEDVANHNGLISAKRKEITAATQAIEKKTSRSGDLAVDIVTLKSDLVDTQESLEEDETFVRNLGKSCETKKAEWAKYQKTQAAEIVALTDTIKILNEDDALDLFKKTLPSSGPMSFIQIGTSAKELRKRASAVLRTARGQGLRRIADPRMDLVQMALRGQTTGFDMLIKKIDGLVVVLKQEQKDDEAKKAYCSEEIGKVEDEKKDYEREIGDIKTVLAENEDMLTAATREIETLVNGLKKVDEDVAKQTELRKEDHAMAVETLATNNAATQLLEVAKQRLMKFYAPKIVEGGAAVAEQAGDTSALQEPPEADFTYSKKAEASGTVMKMLDVLMEDLRQKSVETETEEKLSQADYESFVQDCAVKRRKDSKSITDKEGAKAEIEAKIQRDNEALNSEKESLKQSVKELEGLHGDCDWLLQNFDLREQAREEEVEALNQAKAVLSGADYSASD